MKSNVIRASLRLTDLTKANGGTQHDSVMDSSHSQEKNEAGTGKPSYV